MDGMEHELKKGGFRAFAVVHRARCAARAAAAAAAARGPGAQSSAEPGGEPDAASVVGPAGVAGGERAAEPRVPRRVRADKTTVLPPIG